MNCTKKIIHVDAGGGDHGQIHVAQACQTFLQSQKNAHIILYITQKYSSEIRALFKPTDPIDLCICDSELCNDDKYYAKGTTTMERAIGALYNDSSDHKYSASLIIGNIKYASLIAFRHEQPGQSLQIPNALVSTIANLNQTPRIMLDLGASVTVKLMYLAMIGECFINAFYKLDDYKLGFLNIGSEANKGLPEIIEAAQLYKKYIQGGYIHNGHEYQNLTQGKLYGEHGFIEPNEILMDNDCNVIVSNGFNGNIALKAMQGTINVLKKFVNTHVSTLSKVAAYPFLNAFRSHFNYHEHNGALLSRFKKLIIKSHGNATQEAIVHALRRTCDFYMPNFDKFYALCKDIPAKYHELAPPKEASSSSTQTSGTGATPSKEPVASSCQATASSSGLSNTGSPIIRTNSHANRDADGVLDAAHELQSIEPETHALKTTSHFDLTDKGGHGQ
jgi:glycerol-3-phosphate acyltransferase PlsX